MILFVISVNIFSSFQFYSVSTSINVNTPSKMPFRCQFLRGCFEFGGVQHAVATASRPTNTQIMRIFYYQTKILDGSFVIIEFYAIFHTFI